MNIDRLSKEDREKIEDIVQYIEDQGGKIEEMQAESDFTALRTEVTFRL